MEDELSNTLERHRLCQGWSILVDIRRVSAHDSETTPHFLRAGVSGLSVCVTEKILFGEEVARGESQS